MPARSLFAALVLLAACGGGGTGGPAGPAYGLTQRTVVQGLTFPTGLPQPGPMSVVRAFPNLGFARPLAIVAPPDGTDRLFVVEQDGRIRVFPNDPAATSSTLFLDIAFRVRRSHNEEGLLGLAFHPDYASNGYFYLYYSVSGPPRSRISRWRVSAGDPDVADDTSEEILIEFDQPYGNHNGGCLQFGPDGMLYIASGDGGSGNDPQNNAQNLTNLLGKILRVDEDGNPPADNPFFGGSAGERGEIWAYGLRNPWRMSFDRNTGDLWVGDVGQNAVEEVDLVVRGGNYGWRLYEGDRENINPTGVPFSAFEAPAQTYTHALGFSVTGGYVYRGSATPSIYGAYVYADFVSGRVWALVHDGSQTVSNTQIASMTNPSSFGEDEAGELYICSFDGGIYRLEENGGGSPPFPQRLSETGLFADTAALVPAPGVIEYDVNAPLWSDNARKRRWIALPGSARIGFDATEAWDFPVGTVLVKHFELDLAPGMAHRVETRVLVRHDAGWQGYTYRWNGAQTDADLLPDAYTEVFTVEDPGGGTRQQTWNYPGRADCLSCHTAAAGRVLGVRTRQLNRDFAYPALLDNQLRAWNHIGLFTSDLGDVAQYEALPDPADATAPLADRARAYLAANCANCHRPAGPTPVNLDLRFGIPLGSLNAVGVLATNAVDGLPGALRIDAGAKEQSDLWERLRRLDVYRMPPLGSTLVDDDGVTLIGSWIDSE